MLFYWFTIRDNFLVTFCEEPVIGYFYMQGPLNFVGTSLLNS